MSTDIGYSMFVGSITSRMWAIARNRGTGMTDHPCARPLAILDVIDYTGDDHLCVLARLASLQRGWASLINTDYHRAPLIEACDMLIAWGYSGDTARPVLTDDLRDRLVLSDQLMRVSEWGCRHAHILHTALTQDIREATRTMAYAAPKHLAAAIVYEACRNNISQLGHGKLWVADARRKALAAAQATACGQYVDDAQFAVWRSQWPTDATED